MENRLQYVDLKKIKIVLPHEKQSSNYSPSIQVKQTFPQGSNLGLHTSIYYLRTPQYGLRYNRVFS